MRTWVFSLLFGSALAFAAPISQKWVVRIASEHPIDDLILNPAPELQKDEKTGKTIYIIKGIYYRESWDLQYEGKRVQTDNAGVFYLRIPITGETTTFELVALGPNKKRQSEKIGIVIPQEEEARILKELREEKVAQAESLPGTAAEAPLAVQETPVKDKVDALAPSPTPSPTPETVPAATEGGLFLKRAFVAGVIALQNGANQKNYSVLAGWSPFYRMSSKVSFRLILGATAFEKFGGGRFVMSTSEGLAEWNFHPKWGIAVGPGFQVWWAFGGFNAQAVGELSYYTNLKLFSSLGIERVFAGGAWLFDVVGTKQGRVGAVISF